MVTEQTVADRILEAVMWHPGCSIEELTHLCPGLTWNQIFLTVDAMSRSGRVRLKVSELGIYTVWLPEEHGMTATGIGKEGTN